MAFAQESLVIDVSATDALTPKLEEMRVATKELGAEAKKSLGQFGAETEKAGARAEKGLKNAGDASDVVARKFRTLGKAALGMFTAELASRVIGFSSAMDALNQSVGHVAEGMQALLAGISTDELKRRAQGVADITAAIADMQARQNANKLRIGAQDEFGLFDLSVYARESADALQAARDVLARQQQIMTGLGANNLFGVSTEADRERIRSLLEATPALIDAAVQSRREEVRLAKEAADATERHVERMRTLRELLGDPRFQLSDRDFAKRLTFLQYLQRTLPLLQAGVMASVGFFGFPQDRLPGVSSRVSRSEAETAAANREFRSRVRSGQAQGGAGYFTPAILAGMKATAIEAKRLTTFGGQAQIAFRDLSQSIQQSFAANVVGVGFESFRGFFRDVITGAKSAKDAFRDFALNVVSGMADIFAQQLALRAVSGIFGGFGVPLGQARGGYAVGGYGLDSYASGGVVHGPRPVMLGDNPSRREAVVPLPGAGRSIPVEFVGGRGGSGAQAVQINLAVTSLDPRGAAQVVLSAMPQIQRALVGALGGTDRTLISAVRGA